MMLRHMKSMTGYGRGESVHDGLKIAVEASSVNRKQSEVVVNLPRELEALEPRIRGQINQRISRGRLTVRLSLQAAGDRSLAQARLNGTLAKAYAKELKRLAEEIGTSDTITLDTLLRLPGVVQSDDALADVQAFGPAVDSALARALDELIKMRSREGAHLSRDLRQRVAVARKAVAKVRKEAPLVAKRYRAQLIERVRLAGIENLEADDQRLLKEIVLFADRCDISEELTRLESHFSQFDEVIKSEEPVGRTLDFLVQEMNREVNTIGAKANDALVARAVVTLKAELERFREQVQNVE